MKISFTTPLTNTDGSPITADEAAALQYFVLIDTVNPPLTKYAVPASVIASGTKNTDGSFTVTMDKAEVDLGFTLPAPGTTLYVAAEDEFGTVMSPETAVVTYTVPTPTPSAPGKLSVS